MEKKTKWPSCRLAPQGGSGRIRWHVGQENSWQSKVKFLVFLPIILLSIIALAILLTHIYQSKTKNEPVPSSKTSFSNFDDGEVMDGEEKHILHYIRTSYIPTINPDYEKLQPLNRKTREINQRDGGQFFNQNLSDHNSENFRYNQDVPWHVPMKKENDVSHHKKRIRKTDIIDGEYTVTHSDEDNHQNFWKDRSSPEEIRKTQAHTMMRYMNKFVDPCQDFYKFACGNWETYHPIPPDKAAFDTFEILRENLDVVLRDLLLEQNAKLNPPNHSKANTNNELSKEEIDEDLIENAEDPVKKASNLYMSCINEEIINRRAEKPLLKLLKKLKGWPVLESNWAEEEFDLVWLLGQLRLYNNDILISEWVGPDIKNSGEYLIQFDQTTLGLPTRDYFLIDSNIRYLEAYRVYMITIANLLGAQINNATRDADKMIDFETNLAKITATQDKRRNVSEIYMRMTIGDLQTVVPQVDWIRYLNIIMRAEVDPNQIIICYCLDYLQDLMILLAQTPPRTVANYILWRFVRHRVNNLDNRFHEAKQRFYYVIFGREKSPPRWQTCVTQVNSNMGMTVGSLFVQKYFDENSKNDTLEMTNEIRNSFSEILAESYWLDEETKGIAHLKLEAMRLRIGYPDFILSKATLRERYLDVKIRINTYFENILMKAALMINAAGASCLLLQSFSEYRMDQLNFAYLLPQHLTRTEHERLGKVVDKTIWNTPPAVVNAYYSRNKNQIMFPAGILQPPFYQKYFPRSLNYGGIGVVIGHEITHGFDDKGRLFDQEGNLLRWWRDSSIEEFHERAQCLIDQYNKYIVPDVQIQVDGVTTQGENIADNGGIKQAYRAYTRWLKDNPKADETLPGLNLTNNQLFFLNFAQVWCGSSRPEATRNKIKTAVHAPGQFRVIGTLSNSEDFAKAYNCPSGSAMNPKIKCSIW